MPSRAKFSSDGPWLVMGIENHPTIRLDVRALDAIYVEDGAFFLEVEERVVSLEVQGGPAVAEALRRELQPYTRQSPITDPSIYKDAVAYRATSAYDRASVMVFVGGDAVLIRDRHVQIGRVAFRLEEVEEYAEAGANLPLSGGRLMQAALAALVAWVSQRDREEDLRVLTARLGNYRPSVS